MVISMNERLAVWEGGIRLAPYTHRSAVKTVFPDGRGGMSSRTERGARTGGRGVVCYSVAQSTRETRRRAMHWKVGVLGLIHDHVWNHVPELVQRDDVTLSVADLNPSLLERARTEFGVERRHLDYVDLLEREQPRCRADLRRQRRNRRAGRVGSVTRQADDGREADGR
jgi:hypothetical protein